MNSDTANIILMRELSGASARKVRDQIIADNMNLIRAIAHKYARMTSHLTVEDLSHEGVLGMMLAIDKFNHERGYEFSTYATYWVRRNIMRALSYQGRTIRVPERIANVLPRLRVAVAEYVQQFGYEPNGQVIAESMGLSPDLARAAYSVLSEPGSLMDDNGFPIDVEDESEALDDKVITAIRNQHLQGVIASALTEREASVVCGRFGLGDDGKEHSLMDLSIVWNVSRERIRQIEVEALGKLREALASEGDTYA